MQVLLDIFDAGDVVVLCCSRYVVGRDLAISRCPISCQPYASPSQVADTANSTAKVNPYSYYDSTLPAKVYQPPTATCKLVKHDEDIPGSSTIRVVVNQTSIGLVARSPVRCL